MYPPAYFASNYFAPSYFPPRGAAGLKRPERRTYILADGRRFYLTPSEWQSLLASLPQPHRPEEPPVRAPEPPPPAPPSLKSILQDAGPAKYFGDAPSYALPEVYGTARLGTGLFGTGRLMAGATDRVPLRSRPRTPIVVNPGPDRGGLSGRGFAGGLMWPPRRR